MKTLFICWRPIQLINAVNFVISNYEGSRDNSDLIIVNDFTGSEILYNKIKDLQIFKNVIFTEMEKDRTYLQIIRNFLFTKKYIKDKFGNNYNYSYDKIIASGWNYLVYKFDEVNKHKEKFILLEDGIGSYLGDARKYEFRGAKQRILNILFNKGPYSVKVNIQYLAEPELCEASKYSYPIGRVKLNVSNPNFKEVLSKIFNCSFESGDKKPKYIILDQQVESIYDTFQYETKNEIIKMIISNLKGENIILRKHPNMINDEIDYLEEITVQPCVESWELYALNNIQNTDTLISFHSTALIIPKLLYGKEPNIVCLYKLVPSANKSEFFEIDKFFEKIKLLYKESSKIHIPQSKADFLELLKGI